MGFDNQIQCKILLEWKDDYISYKTLKLFFSPFKVTAKLLKVCQSNLGNELSDSYHIISNEEKLKLKGFYQQFKEIFYSEIEKVNNFMNQQVKICESEWVLIKLKSSFVKDALSSHKKEELAHLKYIFHQFYLKLGYIVEYFKTNEFIISHIQIKFNSLLSIFQDFLSSSSNLNPIASPTIQLSHKLSKESFKDLKILLEKARLTYLNIFYHGFSRSKGDKKLKELFRQSQSKLLHQTTLYSFYFFLGIVFILLIMIIIIMYNGGLDPDSDDQAKSVFTYQFPIFRGFLFIILYIALLAFNVYGWLRNHLNYRGVFGFYKHYSTTSEILSRVIFFSSVWLLTFFIFLILITYFGSQSNFLGIIPVYYLGGVNWLLFILYLFFPSKKLFNGSGRNYTFRIIWKVLSRSFFKVEFPMLFVLNQFTSFVLALKDLEYTACFYISVWLHPENVYPSICLSDSYHIGFLVAFIPNLYRIIQCIRTAYDRKDKNQRKLDIVNVGKFITSGSVIILSFVVGRLKSNKSDSFDFVFNLWIIFASISTIYSYIWDIKMGWCLCEKGYGFLREKMHYKAWVYYLAIVFGLIFRMTWILSLSTAVINKVFWRPELSTFVLGLTEMIRRTMWNFLRIDKEVAKNPNLYKLIPNMSVLLSDISQKSSLKKIRISQNMSSNSYSSFSVDDLLIREHFPSMEDINNVKIINKLDKAEEMKEEDWEFIEESKLNDGNEIMTKEKLDEMKKAIKLFNKQINLKSQTNTLIEIEGKKE